MKRSVRPARCLLLTILLLVSVPSQAAEPSARGESAGASIGDRLVPVPEPTPEAVAYHESGQILWGVGQAWALLVPAVWLLTGLSARLRSLAWGMGRRWVLAVPIFVVLYLILTEVIGLPLAYYRGFVRPHAYGLSRESLAEWAGEELKAAGVLLVLTVPVLTVVYGLMARLRRRWWILTGLGALPLLLVLAMVKPIWIDPLFNDFGPMRDHALEAKILDLAHRAGIDGGRVFEVDKSRQTTTVNAYVTGFLGTKRIVLWDTIVDRLDDDELLVVMGHEMGHYVLNHVVLGLALTSLLIFAGLGFVHYAGGWAIRRWPRRFRFDRLADVASLPLILLLAQVANLALTPIGFAFSRHLEHEADRFALEITRDNRAAASAFVDLQRENLGYPRPGLFDQLWRSTHPGLGDRIDFANTYRPWERGEPLRYESLFRESAADPQPSQSLKPPHLRQVPHSSQPAPP